MKQTAKILCLLFLLVSCFKTSEELQREKEIDTTITQVKSSSKLVADLKAEVQDLKINLARQQGGLEENQYEERNKLTESVNKLQEQITMVETKQLNLIEKIQKLESEQKLLTKELIDQKNYAKKITNILKAKKKKTTKKKSQSKRPHISLDQGVKFYQQAQYQKAIDVLIEVRENPKKYQLKSSDQDKLLYYLGICHYELKKRPEAQTLFSKLYTDFEKSPWSPPALLYLARSFKEIGDKVKAKKIYERLLEKYPGARVSPIAKKELATL